MKKATLPLVILTSLLASCGQQENPQTTSKGFSGNIQFLKENNLIPSENNHVYIIDGKDNSVSELKIKSSKESIESLSYSNNPEVEYVPVKNFIFQESIIKGEMRSQALACSTSTQESSVEPFYKNTFTGAKGFKFNVSLPNSSNVTNYGGGVGHIYGGYASSTSNVESGFQYTSSNDWQPYIRVVGMTNNGYPETSTGGQWSGSWMIPSARFPAGSQVSLTSNSTIGSDGYHYIITTYSYGFSTYNFGYKDNPASPKISYLKPSNTANITVRKVIGLAYQGTTPLAKGAKIINASITDSQYVNSQGTLLTWNRNACVNNTANYYVSPSTTAPSNQDLVTIQ